MYPFFIRNDKVNSLDEFCDLLIKAAEWGAMHRKNESYIDDIFDDLDTKPIAEKDFILEQASYAGAKLISNNNDKTPIVFISHFLGSNPGLIYNAACHRILSDANLKNWDKYPIEILNHLARNCNDSELKKKLEHYLIDNNDLENLLQTYIENQNEKTLDVFYELAEKNKINETNIGRVAFLVLSKFFERKNEVFQKVKNFDISVKKPFFEHIREYYFISINGAKTQIFGQEIVDFDRDVQTYKYNPSSFLKVKNTSYPFNFSHFKINNFNEFLNQFTIVSETLNRDNIDNSAKFIYKICKENTFVKNELNNVIENIILNSKSNEAIVFAIELALLLSNDKVSNSAISRATKEGTYFYCYSLQYNLFNNLVKLGLKTSDRNTIEILIQFLLFKNEPHQLLNFLIEKEDDRFYSAFVMSAKQNALTSEQAEKVVELIIKKAPNKILEACSLVSKTYSEPVAAFKNAALKSFPQYTSEIERIFM